MVDLQQVPSTSTALPAPLHTPQESRVPSGQHHPAPSRALPGSQQVTLLSSTPDGQHCCCASTTPLLQFAATCAKSTHIPYSDVCNGTVIVNDIDPCMQLSANLMASWMGASCWTLLLALLQHTVRRRTRTHTHTNKRCGQVLWVTAMQARMLVTLCCNTALSC